MGCIDSRLWRGSMYKRAGVSHADLRSALMHETFLWVKSRTETSVAYSSIRHRVHRAHFLGWNWLRSSNLLELGTYNSVKSFIWCSYDNEKLEISWLYSLFHSSALTAFVPRFVCMLTQRKCRISVRSTSVRSASDTLYERRWNAYSLVDVTGVFCRIFSSRRFVSNLLLSLLQRSETSI